MGKLASWWKNMIQRWKDFKDDNAGVGVVEIILILANLIIPFAISSAKRL